MWLKSTVFRSNYNVPIECVRSCDQKSYLHNETKGGICIKTEFNPHKNISLIQTGRRFFVYSSNMAAVTSCEPTLYTTGSDKIKGVPVQHSVSGRMNRDHCP